MGAISRFFRGLFSFLGARSTQEERVAVYLIREHDRGRTLNDILDDPYVRNRCEPHAIGRILERPEVIRALGQDIVEAGKQSLTERA